MLVFASNVLWDVSRWWRSTGQRQTNGLTFFQVFEYVREIAAEGHASWSVLVDAGDGNRPYSVVAGGLLPIVILLAERGEDMLVLGIRFPLGEP